jgi:hypothetical protein
MPAMTSHDFQQNNGLRFMKKLEGKLEQQSSSAAITPVID